MMAPARSSNGEALPYGLGWYVEEYQGHTLVWHSGWREDAYSALYLKIPSLDLTFIVLANRRSWSEDVKAVSSIDNGRNLVCLWIA